MRKSRSNGWVRVKLRDEGYWGFRVVKVLSLVCLASLKASLYEDPSQREKPLIVGLSVKSVDVSFPVLVMMDAIGVTVRDLEVSSVKTGS